MLALFALLVYIDCVARFALLTLFALLCIRFLIVFASVVCVCVFALLSLLVILD